MPEHLALDPRLALHRSVNQLGLPQRARRACQPTTVATTAVNTTVATAAAITVSAAVATTVTVAITVGATIAAAVSAIAAAVSGNATPRAFERVNRSIDPALLAAECNPSVLASQARARRNIPDNKTESCDARAVEPSAWDLCCAESDQPASETQQACGAL